MQGKAEVTRGKAMRLQELSFKSWSAGLMSAGLLGMLLGTCGMVRAQEGRDEAKPPQQEEKQGEAKPEKPQEARPEAKPQERREEAKPQHEQEPGRAEQAKPPKENPEMKTGREEHPAQANGGGHAARASAQRGQKIPEEKFHANFGRQHTFRVQKPVVVEGQPRFQYGGYWFVIADPWPVGWDYSDEVYVDYFDGEYVLIDLLHPGVQVAVFVVE